MHTSGFEHIAESIEINRLSEELEMRKAQLQDARNLEIVTLGARAIQSGAVTNRTIHETTWNTVRRHHAMMERIGYAPLRPPELSTERQIMRVDSKRVRIASDISVALRQRGVSSTAGREFWKTVFDEGIDYAIDQHMCPETTLITAFNADGSAVTMNQALASREFRSPDRQFAQEWGNDMLPFLGTVLYKSALEREYEGIVDPTSVHMSDKQLVVAAGFNVVFNGLLDEVEQHL